MPRVAGLSRFLPNDNTVVCRVASCAGLPLWPEGEYPALSETHQRIKADTRYCCKILWIGGKIVPQTFLRMNKVSAFWGRARWPPI